MAKSSLAVDLDTGQSYKLHRLGTIEVHGFGPRPTCPCCAFRYARRWARHPDSHRGSYKRKSRDVRMGRAS